MEEQRAMKAVYVYSNYNLSGHKQSAGDAFSAFKAPDQAGEQAAAAEQQDPHARYTLRRGNLIFKDVTEDGSDGDESDEEEDQEVLRVSGRRCSGSFGNVRTVPSGKIGHHPGWKPLQESAATMIHVPA